MIVVKTNVSLKVLGSATAIPESNAIDNVALLKNHPLTKILPETVLKRIGKRIEKKYGFSERYLIKLPYEKISRSMMTNEALARMSLVKCYQQNPRDVAIFLHGTTTTSRYTGSQATALLSTIHQKCPAYEVKAGCSTSLATLYNAICMMLAGHTNVLMTCSETLSKVINKTNRETWFGLADGAASLFLEKSHAGSGDFRHLGMIYGTDGRYVDTYTTQGLLPPSKEDLSNESYTLEGNGAKLQELAELHYKEMYQRFSQDFDLTKLTHLIPHQANMSVIRNIIKQKFHNKDIQIISHSKSIGNIGGSSILYSLCKSINENHFKANDLILLMSVGGGLSYSMHLLQKT